MKLNPSKNWIAKVLSLLLATAIWFLIKNHLDSDDGPTGMPPRATIVPDYPRTPVNPPDR
jgi:hypothetical protein